MAMTRNYATLGMWSAKAIHRRKKQERKAGDAERAKLAKNVAMQRMVEGGLSFKEAEARYHRALNELSQAKRTKSKSIKRAIKRKREEARQAKKAGQAVSIKTNAIRAQTPIRRQPTPPKVLHYYRGMSSALFFVCWEWQTLRYDVLREFGPKCMCCGGWGNHADHIKPRSKFPELELVRDNLQILCEACNRGKSDIYDDDWRSRGLASGPAVQQS